MRRTEAVQLKHKPRGQRRGNSLRVVLATQEETATDVVNCRDRRAVTVLGEPHT